MTGGTTLLAAAFLAAAVLVVLVAAFALGAGFLGGAGFFGVGAGPLKDLAEFRVRTPAIAGMSKELGGFSLFLSIGYSRADRPFDLLVLLI